MTIRPFSVSSLHKGTSWLTRGLVIVIAAVLVGGFAIVAQPAPQAASATHHECDDQVFRQSTIQKTCVKYIQTMLNNLMVNGLFASLVVDGYYGSKTTSAVRNFQSWERITADGVVGPKTWARFCNPQYATTWSNYHWVRWYNAARAAGCNI